MFESRSGSTEIDENDVNEALDARTEILRRQALSFKAERDVEMESTEGENWQGGGRDACERGIRGTKLIRVARMFYKGTEYTTRRADRMRYGAGSIEIVARSRLVVYARINTS